MARSGMVSTSLHAGPTTAPRPAGRSHRARGTRCSGHQLRVKTTLERKWNGVGERRTERRLQKRANWPVGRKQREGRVVRKRLQPLYVHERLCHTSLVPRPTIPFPSGFPEPESIFAASGSSLVRFLLCRLHRSDRTKTARPLESSWSAFPQALQRVGLSTDGTIPFPSARQCSKPPTGLQEKNPTWRRQASLRSN